MLFRSSSSEDRTKDILTKAKINFKSIKKEEFGHGKTRALAANMTGDVDYLVFLTQDALPTDEHSVTTLLQYFAKDAKLGAVYGRQIPNLNANDFAIHARLFNYRNKSKIFEYADKSKYGIKTAFFSNSFAAYKKEVLIDVGNFPNVDFGEDTCVAAKILLNGFKIGYCADAKVYHSHNYTIKEEFYRYKATGRFHKEQKWLLENFGRAEGEGLKFVKSEVGYLIKNGKWYLLPEAFLRNGIKYLGYKKGNT